MAFEKINEFAADKQKLCVEHDTISDELFREYGVNRGLRDINGKGVLTGLTRISKVVSFKDENGEHVPCDGELWYRGYNINTLIKNLDGFGFEKTAYLLIFGEMPTAQQLAEFNDVLTECRTLPSNFTRDVIMKAPSKDIMNSMTKSILTLSSYDDDIASNSIDNCIRQCLQLTAVFPMLAVYGYHAYNHYENDDSMYIHRPTTGLSTAENFLRLLRPDMQYTELEARVLGHRAHAPHGARRRKQLHVHDPRRYLLRFGYIFRNSRGYVLAEGSASRRREPQGYADDAGYPHPRHRPAGQGRGARVPFKAAGGRGVRRKGSDIRNGSRGVLHLRPARARAEVLRAEARRGEGQDLRYGAVLRN